MAEITSDEFNGLGARLNNVALEQARCQGDTQARLKQIEDTNDVRDQQISRIFQAQESANITLAELKSTIKIWGTIIAIASPIIAAAIGAMVGKIM